MNAELSPHDVRRLSVAAYVHPTTVGRVYRGARVRSTTLARIVDAARSLGLPLPLSAPRDVAGDGPVPDRRRMPGVGGDGE